MRWLLRRDNLPGKDPLSGWKTLLRQYRLDAVADAFRVQRGESWNRGEDLQMREKVSC